MPGKARVPLLVPTLSPSRCNLCPAHGGLSTKAVRPPSLAEWTSKGNPVWKFQPNFLTNKAGAQNYFQKNCPCHYIYASCFYFDILEERNRKAHAENGNTAPFSVPPVQSPAPSVPQTPRRRLFARNPFLFHALACAFFILRLKEVVVDHAFFDALCREPAVAPEVKSLIGTLSSNPKLLTAVMRPDAIAPCMRACMYDLSCTL